MYRAKRVHFYSKKHFYPFKNGSPIFEQPVCVAVCGVAAPPPLSTGCRKKETERREREREREREKEREQQQLVSGLRRACMGGEGEKLSKGGEGRRKKKRERRGGPIHRFTCQSRENRRC